MGRTKTTRSSTYRFRVRLNSVGVNQLRVVAPATRRHRRAISRTVSVTVYGPLRVTSGTHTAYQNQPSNFTVRSTGGYGAKTWRIAGLPAGYTMHNGTISGTTKAYKVYPITMTVTDALHHVASTSFTLDVRPVWTWTATAYRPQTGVPQSLSCVSSRFCLLADAQGSLHPYTSADGTLKDGTWGALASVGGVPSLSSGVYTSVACASSTLCVAVGSFSHYATVYNGTTATQTLVKAGETLEGAACVTGTTTCYVIGEKGTVYQYANGAWTQISTILVGSSWITSFACTSTTTCLATDLDGNLYTWANGTWTTTPPTSSNGDGLSQVSCPTTSYCMAFTNDGTYTVWTGTTWTTPTWINPSAYVPISGGLSCSSSTHCVAVTDNKGVVVWNGTSWSKETDFDPSQTVTLIQCPSDTECLAVGNAGSAFTSLNNVWTSQGVIDPDVSTLEGYGHAGPSCPTTTFCMMPVGNNVATWNGSTWSAPQPVDTTTTGAEYLGITSVACPAATLCLATMNNDVYTWNGTTWGPPVPLGPSNATNTISKIVCPSTSLCLASSGSTMYQWNGSSWTSGTIINNDYIYDFSCPTMTMCVAVDRGGNAEMFNGTTWSSPAAIGFEYPPQAVACTSATYCVAGGIDELASFNGSTWTPMSIAGTSWTDVSQVFCASGTTDCLLQNGSGAPNLDGFAWSHDGGQWDNGGTVDGVTITGGAYLSPTSCLLVGYKNGEIYTLQGTA